VRPPDAAIVWAYLATFLAASVIDVGFVDRVGSLVLFQMLLKDFETGPFCEGGGHGWRRRWGVRARLMRLPACLMPVSRLGLFVTAAAEPPLHVPHTNPNARSGQWVAARFPLHRISESRLGSELEGIRGGEFCI